MSLHNANKYAAQNQQSPDYYSKSNGSSTSSNSSLSSTSSITQQSPTQYAPLANTNYLIKSPTYYNNISAVTDSASQSTIRNSKRSFNECDEENIYYQKQSAKHHCSTLSNVLSKTSPLNTITYQNQYNIPAANNFNFTNQADFSNVIASVQPTSLAYN